MEFFGICLGVPVALVAGTIYAIVAAKAGGRWPRVGRALWWVSLAVLGVFVSEEAALGGWGAVGTRSMMGPAFNSLHGAVTLLTVPAMANALVLRKKPNFFGWWWIVGLLCAALAVGLAFQNIVVDEALYGVDRSGGPFGTGP